MMMSDEAIHIYICVCANISISDWTQSDWLTGRVEAVAVQVMYWWDFADSIMNGDMFRVKDDPRVCTVPLAVWSGLERCVILCFKLSLFKKSCYI